MSGNEKTMTLREQAQQILHEHKEYPGSVGFRWRMSLSTIICQLLDEHEMTQAELARRAGMKDSFVSRIIHGDSNWTCDVAGRLLFALGIREGEVDLAIRPKFTIDGTSSDVLASFTDINIKAENSTHGQKEISGPSSTGDIIEDQGEDGEK